jgi:solute carrier family 50 protein (sugar transporter)
MKELNFLFNLGNEIINNNNNDLNETDNDSFKNILGICGNIIVLFFFISPISFIKKLHKREQDPKDVPYLIMVMTVMNCILWLSYGIINTNDRFFIILGNAIGFPINLIYLCLFFFYKNERKFGKASLYIFPSIIVSLGFFIIFTYVIKIIEVSQFTAMFFNILMYAAPGQNLVKTYYYISNLLFNILFFHYFCFI